MQKNNIKFLLKCLQKDVLVQNISILLSTSEKTKTLYHIVSYQKMKNDE